MWQRQDDVCVFKFRIQRNNNNNNFIYIALLKTMFTKCFDRTKQEKAHSKRNNFHLQRKNRLHEIVKITIKEPHHIKARL